MAEGFWCSGEEQTAEFRQFLREAKRANGGAKAQTEAESAAPLFTEDLLARRLVDRHGERLRYVHVWGRWLVWDGRRWQDDQTRAVIDLTREICREFGQISPKLQARLERASTIEAVERLARSDRRVAATPDLWDGDPYLLNTPDGVLDFRSGKLQPHNPTFYCRKITGAGIEDYRPALWCSFLQRATDGDEALERYLQRIAGYALTGLTRDHGLFVLFGHGANGKSVFLNTLMAALGDYAVKAPADMLLAGSENRHPTELAMLHGARLVVASEVNPGSRWNESRLKELTGGEPITAHFMRQDDFTYTPAFKLMLGTNHKPRLRTVDEAVKRRLHLIPFTVTIPPAERDPMLPEKLREELGGILTWCVEGAAEWLAGGLQPPDAVVEHTQEYFDAEDRIGEWIEARCDADPENFTRGPDLLKDFRHWLEEHGEGSITRTPFYEALAARGFKTEIRYKVVWVRGLALRTAGERWRSDDNE